MSFMTILGMILLAFLLGVRHGIDWDHITAIVDLVGGESDKRRGFLLTLWYAAGHELVIIVFGCVAVLLGVTLPHWVDGIMERVVGVTLLILAVVFVISLIRDDNEPMISRWRLLFVGFYNLFGWMAEKVDGQRRQRSLTAPIRVNRWGAFGIGIIHGIGAENADTTFDVCDCIGTRFPTGRVHGGHVVRRWLAVYSCDAGPDQHGRLCECGPASAVLARRRLYNGILQSVYRMRIHTWLCHRVTNFMTRGNHDASDVAGA